MPNRTLVVAQSGGATAVINATLAGVVAGARRSGAFDRVLGAHHGLSGLLQSRFADLTALSDTDLIALSRTPSAALGTSRRRLVDGDIERIDRGLRQEGCRDLVLIGGNDSADTAMRLDHAYSTTGLRVLLAPKTIDNDLPGTDHCPGYASAARCFAMFVRDATYDSLAAPDLYPVKLIDVGGRDAGWLAAAGAIAFEAGEDDLHPLVVLPERPPESAEALIAVIAQHVNERSFAVCVIPETTRDASGAHLSGEMPAYVDPFGHPYQMPPAVTLAAAITTALGINARFERPGSAIRMGMTLTSSVDRQEAFAVGEAAASGLADGERGMMVTIERQTGDGYHISPGRCALAEVANRVRPLDEQFIAGNGLGITDAFRAWVRPVLGPNPFPTYYRL